MFLLATPAWAQNKPEFARDGNVAASAIQADAGDDQAVMEEDTVTLDGRASTASGGVEIASYRWRADDGNDIDVTLEDADEAVATFTLPNLLKPVKLTFELTVTGDGGETDTDKVKVRVSAKNSPPSASARADPGRVNEGGIVTLTGTGGDPEERSLTFAWKVKALEDLELEFADSNSAMTTLTIPIGLKPSTRLDIEFSASDGANETTATVRVVVIAVDPSFALDIALSEMGRMMAQSARDVVSARLGLGAASAARSNGLSLNGNHIGPAMNSWLRNWLPLSVQDGPGGVGLGSRDGSSSHDVPGRDVPSRDAAGGVPRMAMTGRGAYRIALGDVCGNGRSHPALAGCDHFAERTFDAEPSGLPPLMPWDDLSNAASLEYAFGMPSPDTSQGDASNISVWGRFDTRSYRNDSTTWSSPLEGSLTTIHLGVDKRYNGRDVAGIALGLPSGTAYLSLYDAYLSLYEMSSDIALRMVNFHPYISWSPDNGRFNVWGMFGFGFGESEVTTRSRGTMATDISMTMFAGGTSRSLTAADGRGFGDIHVVAKADVFAVNTSSDETSDLAGHSTTTGQLRGMFEGRITLGKLNATLLDSVLELGMLFANIGPGLETAFGTSFTNTKLGLSADGRMHLLVFLGGGWTIESGFSLLVQCDPGGAGGLALSLAPVWGETTNRADALWHARDISKFVRRYDPSNNTPRTSSWHPDQMEFALRYGLERTHWMVTPYGSFVMGNGDRQHARLGVRLEHLNLKSGTMHLNLFSEPSQGPGIEITLRHSLR